MCAHAVTVRMCAYATFVAARQASWASSVAAMQKRLSQLEKAKRAERRRMQREDFARVQARPARVVPPFKTDKLRESLRHPL